MSYSERVSKVSYARRVRGYSNRVNNTQEAITPGEGYNVEAIVLDYQNDVPVDVIFNKYSISSGQLTSHLSALGVERRKTKRREGLHKKLAKYTPQDIQSIIKDYTECVMYIEDIFKKYDIHKNGLYYLLDTHGIERRGRKRVKEGA